MRVRTGGRELLLHIEVQTEWAGDVPENGAVAETPRGRTISRPSTSRTTPSICMYATDSTPV